MRRILNLFGLDKCDKCSIVVGTRLHKCYSIIAGNNNSFPFIYGDEICPTIKVFYLCDKCFSDRKEANIIIAGKGFNIVRDYYSFTWGYGLKIVPTERVVHIEISTDVARNLSKAPARYETVLEENFKLVLNSVDRTPLNKVALKADKRYRTVKGFNVDKLKKLKK